MSKSRKQLEAEGYQDFHEFGNTYFRVWLFVLVCLIGVAMIAFMPLLTPDYELPKMGRCGGKGCLYVYLIYFFVAMFMTLPVWFKFPTAAFLGGNGLWQIIQRIKRAVDGKPDFALGPHGLYFPGKKQYVSVPWEEIARISVVRIRNTKKKNSPLSEPTIQFMGFKPVETRQYPVWPLAEPVIHKVAPVHGFDFASVMDSIKRHRPDIPVSEIEQTI